MADADAVQRGRESFRQAAWEESYRLLEAVDRETPLQAEDLERLATAAYLVGRDDESEAAWARAHSRPR